MDDLAQRYRNGATLAELAKAIGRSTYTVRKLLIDSGVEIRKPIMPNGGGSRKAAVTLPAFVDTACWFEAAYRIASIPQIANAIGRSVGFVAGRLKKYRVKTRSISEASKTLDRASVIRAYESLGSMSKVAAKLGCSLQGVKNVLIEQQRPIIPTSAQFSGAGNPFFGKNHNPATKAKCREIGAIEGTKFWRENPWYIEVVREKQRLLWADLERRAADSLRISQLRQQGGCRARKGVSVTRFGQISFDSSYECAFLEHCAANQNIVGIERDFMLIEYQYQGKRNFIPDFRVWLSNGEFIIVETKAKWLQLQPKEQAKIAAGLELFRERFLVVETDFSNFERVVASYLTPQDFNFSDLRLLVIEPDQYRPFYLAYHRQGSSKRDGWTFGAFLGDRLIAAGTIAGITRIEMAQKQGLESDKVRELVRFCIHPDFHKKNLGTWFLSRLVKSFKAERPAVEMLISFADLTQGHEGTVYKAANWAYDGLTGRSYHYEDESGRKIHKKTVYEAARRIGITERQYVVRHGLNKVWHKRKKRYLLRL